MHKSKSNDLSFVSGKNKTSSELRRKNYPETHHSSVSAIFVGAPDSVLARVRPVHTISGRVKIQGHDVASISNQRADHVGLGCDVILHDLIAAGYQQKRLPRICKHKQKSQTSILKLISSYQHVLANKNSTTGLVNRAYSNGDPRECTFVQIGPYCITRSFNRLSVLKRGSCQAHSP